MDRPDINEAIINAQATLREIDASLANVQNLVTNSRFVVTMAIELNAQAGDATFDQIIKSQIFSEAMGNLFSKVIEGRTHLDVAANALAAEPPAKA